jgi:hypothetical protein
MLMALPSEFRQPNYNPELFIRVLLEKLARHVKKGTLLKMAAIF